MAITLRSTSTVASGTRTNTTVSAPTGHAAGDVIVVAMECGGNPLVQPTGPSGWTLLGRVTYQDNDPWFVDIALWAKVRDGASSWTWTHASHATQAYAWCLTGADNTNIADATAVTAAGLRASGTGLTAVAPSLTTVTAGAWRLIVRGSWDGNAITPPSGWVEDYDVPVIWTGHREEATPGASGTVSVPAGNSSTAFTWGIVHGAIRPAATGGGTTPVTASKTTTWRVQSAVSSPRTSTWRVRASVATLRSSTWDVCTSVTATRATSWRVLARPETTQATTWDVRTQVTTERTTSWNVDGTITQVTTTRSSSWRTAAAVTANRSTSWRTTAAVATVRSAAWDTRQSVTTTRSAIWDARTPVTAARSTSWDTAAIVHRMLTTAWDVRQQVTIQRSSTWNVDSTMTAVTAQRITTWRTLARPTASRWTGWDTRALVANTRPTTWDVRTAIALARTTSWRALARAAAARSTTWDTRELAIATRATSWRVQSELPEPAPPRLTVGLPRPGRYTADAGRPAAGLTAGPPRTRYQAGDPR